MEILKCAWEQVTHAQKIQIWENIENGKHPGFGLVRVTLG